jgi:hypothetical protein
MEVTLTDIVERLRNTPMLRSDVANGGLCREAADEIERLRADLNQAESNGIEFETQRDKALAEIERLRNLILGACNIFDNLDAPQWAAEFRRALEPKP